MKEKVQNFIVFYQRLEPKEKIRVRDEFLARTKLSYPSWYAKLCRKVFTPLELEALGGICGRNF